MLATDDSKENNFYLHLFIFEDVNVFNLLYGKISKFNKI